jgi:hypothetical protein
VCLYDLNLLKEDVHVNHIVLIFISYGNTDVSTVVKMLRETYCTTADGVYFKECIVECRTYKKS